MNMTYEIASSQKTLLAMTILFSTIYLQQLHLRLWSDDEHIIAYILQVLCYERFIDPSRRIHGEYHSTRIRIDLRALVRTVDDI